MTASPSTVPAAIAAARADERQRFIAFLRRESGRRDVASLEMNDPDEAELFASDAASFATAAGLLAVAAAVWATSPEEEGADIEAGIRADERAKCAGVLRDQAAVMSRRGELIASTTASYLSGLIDPLGPVMGAPAAGGTT